MGKKKNTKEKGIYSVGSNFLYMLKLMFSISPGLVIGEILINVLAKLPDRLVSVIGLKFIIDEVQDGSGNTVKIFTGIGIMVFALIVGAAIQHLFFELYSQREYENLYYGIHKKLYDKAIKLDLASYDNASFYSDFILAIETSSSNIQNVLGLVKNYIADFIALLMISSVVLTIDPICLVIVLVFVLAFIPISRHIGDLQMKRRIEITEKHRKGDYFARLFYLPDYAGEIRMNGLNPLLMKRFGDAADDIVSTQKKHFLKIDSLYFLQSNCVEVIGFMLVLTLYIGYRALVTESFSAGDFVATFNGAVQIGNSIMFLTINMARNLTERSKMIEKYRTFLACDVNIFDGEKTAECGEPKTIKLENVSFTYPGNGEPTLKNINMEIKPYEKIALVGYNGAGKTTLTNLLLRLYDVTEGIISVDGVDIRDVTVSSHRDRFAAVFQDFKIFGATVGENVALTKNYDKKRVYEALEAAGFDKELPDGLDTVLLREFSDDGMMLSGGEQQKIAIARAFYKNCPFVILDEPSANLDPLSEYELNHSIIEAAKDKTVVFISHRLSTTRIADRIFMMENGEIVESGSHEELMALGGKYAYMFELQAEKYVATIN